MPKCEKCPREVEAGQAFCRYHRAEQQVDRAGWVENALEWGGKALPFVLLFIPSLRGKLK
jgi:hypothetical protein